MKRLIIQTNNEQITNMAYQTFFSSPLYLSATGNFDELIVELEQLNFLTIKDGQKSTFRTEK